MPKFTPKLDFEDTSNIIDILKPSPIIPRPRGFIKAIIPKSPPIHRVLASSLASQFSKNAGSSPKKTSDTWRRVRNIRKPQEKTGRVARDAGQRKSHYPVLEYIVVTADFLEN